ncbi:MAG: 2-phospho-L-lactate transferase [Anaerolineales bacterium]|nr:2-phospho-L-lactate transferase [Anaerolineales bacterium]MCB8953403.1 2-phospho-L-lactate transferase [Ardenticatenales bacterium]
MSSSALRTTDSPQETQFPNLNVVCLAGGVGGAKLAHGLARVLPAAQLTIIGNTGDDFRHCGLTICPDLDTVMYTLAGVANAETGWGRGGESWTAFTEMGRLGGADWFRLGDLDLAAHLTRAHLLEQGKTLTAATAHLCAHLGVLPPLLPMSDAPAPTQVATDEGVLAFQEWFVHRRWQPRVRQVVLPEDVKATPQVMRALSRADVVIIAPSNPFVSIDPILNVYPIREMVADLPALVAAVSPIIAGIAVKGPAAKMMQEMGLPNSAAAIADYYADLVDLFVYDEQDAGITLTHNPHHLCTNTIMRNTHDRERLAREILNAVVDHLAA